MAIRILSTTTILMIIFLLLSGALAIDDKCLACKAIAAELESAFANEKPRNHLDMRHRLDSTGKREGKLIDYRVSELRVVDLLDGLCERMKDYTIDKDPSGKGFWMKVEDWSTAILTIEKQEAQGRAKEISTFCGRLLEKIEEELADKIKSGAMSIGGVENILCDDLSKLCSSEELTSEKSRNQDDEL